MAKKLLDAASTIDVQKAQQLVEPYECMVHDVKMRGKQDSFSRMETIEAWLKNRCIKLTDERVLELEELFDNYAWRKQVRDVAFKHMEKH